MTVLATKRIINTLLFQWMHTEKSADVVSNSEDFSEVNISMKMRQITTWNKHNNSGMNKALRKQRTEQMAKGLTFEEDIEEWQKVNTGGMVLLAHAKRYIVKDMFEGIFNVIGYCVRIENWARIQNPEINGAPYIV